ncbi:BglII/BstYI family type II restriction endonuclease [Ilumatobacter coccineus]|uniref:Restriction endonuclease n=1 Tax=Ilumatobacter coccineus (strain NBRC 103263 / KCTC 29153 / YM16-304) TaxID=1313172 RepID=A0A6C7EDT6_ILUCY|nr:BglII/BstYI family type II restriction endonuclease [Ilumatobacter coccineus]BAN03349.1 hypothetical protein YM304_30350 [Ilumatobacter coccineus YM16-304]
MDFTHSYREVFPADVLDRYDWLETRNASAIVEATNAEQFGDLVAALRAFAVDPALDIFPTGGNESNTAARLNAGLRDRGWREGSYTVALTAELRMLAYGEDEGAQVLPIENEAASYLIDNIKGRIAVDVEWHAKDGNLDRDLAAYRSLYNEGIIDAAAIITMHRAEMRAWARRLDPETTKFNTSTTTNLEKVTPRLERGDSGGCPVLIVAVCQRTV